MRLRSFLCLPLMLLLLSVPVFAEEPEFTPLFNGQDLSGWSGDSALWRVEEGVIVGTTEPKKIEQNTFLSHEKPFKNFVLRVKVKLRNGNSGVQFRSEQRPDHVVAGYQADIAEKEYFGLLYEERLRGILPYWNEMSQAQRDEIQAQVKKGDWNEYEITANGDHIKMVLNGYTVCDLQDPEGAKEGIIALQLHVGPPMEVRFKDIEIRELPPTNAPDKTIKTDVLTPDYDATRREKVGVGGARFLAPEGFTVEELATNTFTGSIINMTIDHRGRPALATERGGVLLLEDSNGDGVYDTQIVFTDQVKTNMGMHYTAPGVLLLMGNGPEGPGLYRATDKDGDDRADEVETLAKADGNIGEHGPHAMAVGLDGHVYVMYGNHARPGVAKAAGSPLGRTEEDHLLNSYVDPRGHATEIRAPGGTLQRFTPDFKAMETIAGGFRNAYDFAFNESGEVFTFDSDMEWDIGMPWFRPIRVAHVIPGGDYGWRTGSRKMPVYYLDTLPSVDDIGRGSPVGVCAYHHTVYPPEYRDALFLGDWSRGRIRVLFPERSGASYGGTTQDFVLGEPLNVTDMEVGPDGWLYFSTGGRGTVGGLYRVRYGTAAEPAGTPRDLEGVLAFPNPRSAHGLARLAEARTQMGDGWQTQLEAAAQDTTRSPAARVRALELLQRFGTPANTALLATLATDESAELRAAAVLLLGLHPLNETRESLTGALADADPLVARRACESLVRSGLSESTRIGESDAMLAKLLALLGHEDKFLRYAARTALQRVYADYWRDTVLSWDLGSQPHALIEGLLALVYTQRSAVHADGIRQKLADISAEPMEDEVLLDYMRLVGLAQLRDVTGDVQGAELGQAVGSNLLERFPTGDTRVNREIQVLLAHFETPGAVEALLAYLSTEKPQEEQIHTVYCLREIESGWSEPQRAQLVAWFDHGRTLRGGASAEGFINNLWQSTLALLPEAEKEMALARAEEARKKKLEAALALLDTAEGSDEAPSAELVNMSFDELSEYLEYDPGAYRSSGRHGEAVFVRSRCASCHVFGEIGTGGGPDLSTVTSRFRRRDILEAIMYPSKVVSDQYTAVEVETADLESHFGMLAGETAETLSLITVDGQRVEIRKEDITSQTPSTQSAMPEGLLNTMSLGDLVALVNFLERGARS